MQGEHGVRGNVIFDPMQTLLSVIIVAVIAIVVDAQGGTASWLGAAPVQGPPVPPAHPRIRPPHALHIPTWARMVGCAAVQVILSPTRRQTPFTKFPSHASRPFHPPPEGED
jgi:hypothetical protein